MNDLTTDSVVIPVEWGLAEVAAPGQTESGDLSVVLASPQGVVVAVADGLGHGHDAAMAARTAIATVKRHAAGSVISIVQRCHEACRGTRGVAMSLALCDTQYDAITWLGVGNIEGLLIRDGDATSPRRESLLLHNGVVGYSLPTLRPSVLPITHGDTLVFATDGVRSRFMVTPTLGTSPQHTADRILSTFGTRTDDALVLVVRYGRPRP